MTTNLSRRSFFTGLAAVAAAVAAAPYVPACVRSHIKAWVRFSGRDAWVGGNVSRIEQNGAGDYTIYFTTTLSTAGYEVSSRL